MPKARRRLRFIGILCGLAVLAIIISSTYLIVHRDAPQPVNYWDALYELQPDEPISVEQAVAFVCKPRYGFHCVSSFEVQVYYRIVELGYCGAGYRFQPPDADKWRALLQDDTASIYGRMCAARFLLELDDPSARAFLEKQLASEDLRRTNNAAWALMLYVGVDPSKEWGIHKMIELISNDRLVGKMDASLQIRGDWHDYPEGDYGDYGPAPFSNLCEHLGWVKSRDAVTALMNALERHPKDGAVAYALAQIGDPRATPALTQALKGGGNDHRLMWALGRVDIQAIQQNRAAS